MVTGGSEDLNYQWTTALWPTGQTSWWITLDPRSREDLTTAQYTIITHHSTDQKKTADRPDRTRLPYIPCSWASTVYYPALIAHKKKLDFRVKIELALFNEISLIITCIWLVSHAFQSQELSGYWKVVATEFPIVM